MTRIGISNLKFSFRDVEINVKHREFETELFDKTDAFLFSIVRMPYQDRSIPTRIFFYAAVGSEILRFARTTFSIEKFQNFMTTLLTRTHR